MYSIEFQSLICSLKESQMAQEVAHYSTSTVLVLLVQLPLFGPRSAVYNSTRYNNCGLLQSSSPQKHAHAGSHGTLIHHNPAE